MWCVVFIGELNEFNVQAEAVRTAADQSNNNDGSLLSPNRYQLDRNDPMTRSSDCLMRGARA